MAPLSLGLVFPLIPDAFSSLVPYLFPLLRVWAYHQLHLLITSHQYIVISSPETRAAKDDILSLALVLSLGTFFSHSFPGISPKPPPFLKPFEEFDTLSRFFVFLGVFSDF